MNNVTGLHFSFRSWLFLFTVVAFQTLLAAPSQAGSTDPLRVAVVGLVHGHVHWILGREERGDIQIVGIVEADREVAEKFSKQYNFPIQLIFKDMESMVKAVQPEAVTAFNAIYDHLETVRFCAPRGIHVMVEKPLAVSWEHAREMIALAEEHGIALLTNFETSWYPTTYRAYEALHTEGILGPPRKMVFRTGHPGPKEIGCDPEFLDWLTDPVMNGGGALTDFGCYGANLSTWLMKGQAPLTVQCTVQSIKPEIYPKVEDEATIVLTYPQTQVIIQASWNWPYNVKSMDIYGKDGYLLAANGTDYELLKKGNSHPQKLQQEIFPDGPDDPFALLAAVVRGQHKLQPNDLASPENNAMVVKILDAARHSASTGETVIWDSYYK